MAAPNQPSMPLATPSRIEPSTAFTARDVFFSSIRERSTSRFYQLIDAGSLAVEEIALKGLANGIHKSTDGFNAKYVKTVCDKLRVYNEP